MKNTASHPLVFNSLTEVHRIFGLSKPLHPLISFINLKDVKILENGMGELFILNFYKIAYKNNLCGQARYGQHFYDFGEGGLIFTAPGQTLEKPPQNDEVEGSMLLIHPDYLLSYGLASKIKQYGFFSYSANEALHVSDLEKNTIMAIFSFIDDELENRIDDFSHDVIISQLELLLNYANRFYKRQFLTRKAINNDLLSQLEELLEAHFSSAEVSKNGIPTVQFLADKLNLSSGYLSDMLRSLTGQNAQQHIHSKLIEKAKEKLSGTNLTVNEIAYELGYEHPQSFSKFFKTKTNFTPGKFRESFN